MNVLIVGLGVISLKHIAALRSLVQSPVIYALRSGHTSNEVEGVVNVKSLDEINVPIDFAIISNSTHQHYSTIKSLAERKINLFIEKPPLHNLEGVKELTDLVEKQEIITYSACNLRFHPCLIKLKEMIDELPQEEKINEVNVYCGSYLPEWRPGKEWRKMYSANKEMGGGVHLDLFHEIDYTYWILGEPLSSSKLLRHQSSLNISAIDYANYTWEYDGFTAGIVLNYYRRDAKRTFEVVTSERTILTDLIKHEIRQGDEVIFKAENFSVLETYTLQMKYFLDHLQTQEACENNFNNTIKAFTLCIN